MIFEPKSHIQFESFRDPWTGIAKQENKKRERELTGYYACFN